MNNSSIVNDQDVYLMNNYIMMYNNVQSQINSLLGQLDRIQDGMDVVVNRIQHRVPAQPSASFRPFANQRTGRSNRTTAASPVRNSIIQNRLSDLLSTFFTNVPVVPTEQDIQRASRLVLYREIENPINTSCPISLEPFTADQTVRQLRHCSHIFYENEFNSWFQNNVRCPVCRHDIRSQPTTDESNNVDPVPNQNPSPNPVNPLPQPPDLFNLMQTMLLPQDGGNSRLLYDPSNNMFIYDSVFRR